MKKMQKNNKGFSLVELIVVILIMAIIAVALAPQVMKWVDSSRISTDNNNRATLKNSVDAAVADYLSENKLLDKGKKIVLKIKADTANVSGIDSSASTTGIKDAVVNDIKEKVGEVLNYQFPDVKQDSTAWFEITITDTGAVTVVIKNESGILSGEDL